MDKYYKRSRVIMVVLAAVTGLILALGISGNDLSSINVSIGFFSVLTLIITTILKPISKQIIAIGDRIKNKILKFFYYISFLPLSFLIFILGCAITANIGSMYEGEGWTGLDVFFILMPIVIVLSSVPYMQSLIMLGLRFNDRMKQKFENNQE